MRDFDLGRDRVLLERVLARCGRPVDRGVCDAIGAYVELVARWNRKLDLTAARGPEAQLDVLVADAGFMADEALCPAGARLLDVGTGAGAPIVPLLLLRPDLEATCVEPLHKRVAFLRTVSGRLQLVERMRVLEQKLSTEHPAVAGTPFDVALSRATFAPERWLSVGAQLASAVLVAFVSGEPPACAPQSSLETVVRYELPSSRAPRALARYVLERRPV